MRLLFVHDHRFVRGPNGAFHTVGSFPRSVWQRYLAHFDEIVVVARDGGALPPGSDLARSDLPQVRFVLVDDYSLPQRLFGLRGQAREVLERELASADALLVRLPSDLGNLAARVASRRGVPCAVEAVGCALDGYANQGSRSARLYAPLAMKRMRDAIAGAEQVLYVTKRFLQDRYPSPADAVGVSDVEIEALTEPEIAARHARLSAIAAGRAPVFGTIASLRIKSKGIQDAIAAVAALRAKGLRVDYRVLGAGERQPWIAMAEAAGVGDTVHFDGSRPSGEGVRGWLDGIDVHLQPSYQEGLPRATVEAMSRGCACLGSTIGGLPELLPPDRLHRPGDVLRLAQLIETFANEPDKVRRASEEDLAASADYLSTALDATRAAFLARLAARASRA
jgi:glycosyltransferase involved in cell wall biosynthesis